MFEVINIGSATWIHQHYQRVQLKIFCCWIASWNCYLCLSFWRNKFNTYNKYVRFFKVNIVKSCRIVCVSNRITLAWWRTAVSLLKNNNCDNEVTSGFILWNARQSHLKIIEWNCFSNSVNIGQQDLIQLIRKKKYLMLIHFV